MRILATGLLFGIAAFPAVGHDTQDKLHEIEALFADATIVAGPELVSCTLSGGTKTDCFKITVKPDPQEYTPGPWCPGSIEADAAEGGVWPQDGKLYDVDGSFIANLAEFYDDPEWQLYNPQSGAVRVTDSKAACDAAARPDVDEAYQNYCVQCLPDYLPADASVTYVIPLVPQPLDRPAPVTIAGSGLAYNGVRLDGPAPVGAILSAHTLAPFDDCGGHLNLRVGYHYHAVTDCLEAGPTVADHSSQIGIAMDGYAIYNREAADGAVPADLDACNGHESAALGYHYHAGAAGSN